MRDYLKLVKFRHHILFVSVIIGALFFAKEINFALFLSLLLVYISFNLFLYTGIYTFNDIIDRKSDRKHPIKKKRSIASGRISVASATIFSIVTLVLGLAIAYFAFRNLFYIYLIFIASNLLYSFVVKKIPYFEIFYNAITHPLRFFMGGLLVGAIVPTNVILICLFVSLGIANKRRITEYDFGKGHKSRRVLKYYNKPILLGMETIFFLLMIVFIIMDLPNRILLNSLFILAYLIFVYLFGYTKLNIILKKFWLN